MTAPTRAPSRDALARTATRVKPPSERSNSRPGSAGERSVAGRNRSTTAQRAYARRARRTEKVIGAAGERSRQQMATARAPRAPFVVLVMGLLIIGVGTTLWLSTQATADSYRLEQAKQQATTLAEQVEQLQADVAREQSPGALADKARAFGMVPAGDPAHLVLGNHGEIRVVGQPEVARRPTPPPDPQPVQQAQQDSDQPAHQQTAHRQAAQHQTAQHQTAQHQTAQHRAAQHQAGAEPARRHRSTPAERATIRGD